MRSSRLGGLTTRLALAMAAVAVIAPAVVGIGVAPLIRSTTEQAVREPLARQADVFARVPAAAQRPWLTRVTERADLNVGTLDESGRTSGPATLLTNAERTALLAGEPLSTSAEDDGVAVLIEARPSVDGGAVVIATDADIVDDATTALRRRLLLAALVGLAVSAVIGTLVAGHFGRPLRATARAARRMAAGERGVAVPEGGPHEIADVAQAMRALDEALTTSEARQREFLMSVSHELRTPLTAIRGYAEAIEDGVVPAAEQSVVGRTLREEALRLERYVDDLLALARLQADGFTLDPTDVDLAELVRTAAAVWADRGQASGVTVRAEAGADVGRLVTDGGRLRQVLDALLDNAVRVCGPGDHIIVAARRRPDAIVLEVRDSGPGLTDDDAAVAFVAGALHARYSGVRPGGHGLGLAIVQGLVAVLGGTIRVTRAHEGGAAFEVRLPTEA